MKKIFYIFLLLLSYFIQGQSKYITKTGLISFEASVPSFEEVTARNNAVTAIINTQNGEFASLALVNGFRFKNALMEEHFNENYAESSEFPKTTFKGKIIEFSLKSNEYKIEGDLTFHGKTKSLKNIPIKLEIIDNEIIMSGNFEVKTSDFEVKIPKIVANKVSELVKVNFLFKLIKK